MNIINPLLRRTLLSICSLVIMAMAWVNIQSLTSMTNQHSHPSPVHTNLLSPSAQLTHNIHCTDSISASNSEEHSTNSALCEAACAVHGAGGIPSNFELATQLYFPTRFPPAVDVAIPSLHLAPTPPPPKRV